MSKPLGGRGKKAPYETVIIRIPIDVKEQVEEIVERFRSGDLEIVKSNQGGDNIISQLNTIIDRYKTVSKSSRDWTKCNQLIQELETEIARHE
jgi:chorismate mutase